MDPDTVMNRERTRVRRWLARPRTEALVRRLARALTQSQVILDRDLDALFGGERSGEGLPALPFRCFEWMDELAAKLLQERVAA